MSSDLVLRAAGHIAFMCTTGLFITAMSVAALNAASMSAGPRCPVGSCITVALN